jgi:hypothetical protein
VYVLITNLRGCQFCSEFRQAGFSRGICRCEQLLFGRKSVWLMARDWSVNQSKPMPCSDHVLYAISYQLLSLRLSRTAHESRS